VRFALQSANAGTGFWDLLAQIVEQPVPLPPPGAGMSQQLRDFLTCTLVHSVSTPGSCRVQCQLHLVHAAYLVLAGHADSIAASKLRPPSRVQAFDCATLSDHLLSRCDRRACCRPGQDPAQRPSAAELLQHPFLQPAPGDCHADPAELVARAAAAGPPSGESPQTQHVAAGDAGPLSAGTPAGGAPPLGW